jgi:hypothetical protein
MSFLPIKKIKTGIQNHGAWRSEKRGIERVTTCGFCGITKKELAG